MSTKEIHDLIQTCDHCGQGGTLNVLKILEKMNDKLAELESRFEQAEAGNRRTATIASCLANGIQPD